MICLFCNFPFCILDSEQSGPFNSVPYIDRCEAKASGTNRVISPTITEEARSSHNTDALRENTNPIVKINTRIAGCSSISMIALLYKNFPVTVNQFLKRTKKVMLDRSASLIALFKHIRKKLLSDQLCWKGFITFKKPLARIKHWKHLCQNK